eukprot:4748336-Pleurochrysis_carterae.AAC.2
MAVSGGKILFASPAFDFVVRVKRTLSSVPCVARAHGSARLGHSLLPRSRTCRLRFVQARCFRRARTSREPWRSRVGPVATRCRWKMRPRQNTRRRWGVRADVRVPVRPALGSRTRLSSLPGTTGRFRQPVECPGKSEGRWWKV